MPKQGYIVLIEDDQDDKELLIEIIRQIDGKHEVLWFDNCDAALTFLRETPEPVFIIFSDINLPRKTGIELKYEIDREPALQFKSIPFIFYSTSTTEREVDEAFSNLNIQGFFKKENSYCAIKSTIEVILQYWSLSKRPGDGK